MSNVAVDSACRHGYVKMERLAGSTVRIVLSVEKGTGFNFLKRPIIISCAIDNNTLETDPVKSRHVPSFDAKLVWETEKETFKELCLQNVTIKIEVLTIQKNGKRQPIGYLLMSLLSAKVDSIYEENKPSFSWYKLLGLKHEGRSSNPQLFLKLTLEESLVSPKMSIENSDILQNQKETSEKYKHIKETKDVAKDLIPQTIVNTEDIQIGDTAQCQESFSVNFSIVRHENLQLLLSINDSSKIDMSTCFFSLTIFSKTIKMQLDSKLARSSVSVNLRSTIAILFQYFEENPYTIIRCYNNTSDLGLCYFDFRKMVPTNNTSDFLIDFCDSSETFTCKERCFILSPRSNEIPTNSKGKKPFIDLEVTLKFISQINSANNKEKNSANLRSKFSSKNSLKESNESINIAEQMTLSSVSSNKILQRPGSNDSHANQGQLSMLNDDIGKIVKKMNLLMPVSCSSQPELTDVNKKLNNDPKSRNHASTNAERIFTSRRSNSSDSENELSPRTKENNILQIVNELEDWKECQQEMYKSHLKHKEKVYIETLTKEWTARREEHENNLIQNIEHCQDLMFNLNDIIENLKKRELHLEEQEKNLQYMRNELELDYRSKCQELKEASKQMENEFEHQLKLHKIEYSKVLNDVKFLTKENASLKETLKIVDTLKNAVLDE